DGGMPQAGLHQFERELEPTIDAPVDAPGGIEMAERMPAVFGADDRLAVFIPGRLAVFVLDRRRDAGREQRRDQGTPCDVDVTFDAAVGSGKDQPELPVWAGQLPFAQRADQRRRQRDGALTGG